MVEGVLVLDRQGRVQLVNRAAQEMLAVDASAVGRRYLEVIRHPDISAQLTAALRGADVEPHELPLGRDSSRVFVARAAPVSAAGGGGAILVLHDITDLKRADQIRRDFVANVSHELRTPLTAIRGYVEALLDEPPDPEQTRQLPRNRRAAQRADGSPGQRSAAARAARRPPGTARHRALRARADLFVGRQRPCAGDRRQAAARDDDASRRRRARSPPIPPSCTTSSATWSRTP